MGWVGAIIRFVVSALVLMLLGYIVPGFAPLGFWYAVLAAIVISLLGYVVEALFGHGVSPYSRGLVGFLVSAAVIWVTQFLVPTMHVTVLGALIAALVIGIVDLFVPTTIR
ncbi:MAG: phage holin family protein [Actinomycetia bacterium]|jgi:putative membrane protein|nr:phage holin family protein [Actinomycetes bacterium]